MVNGQTYRDFDQLTIDQSITTENWWLVNGQTHRVFDQLTIDQLTNISMRGVWVTQKKIEAANSNVLDSLLCGVQAYRGLLDKRYAALDEVGEVLALEHTIREQCEVDDLAHLAVLATNLLEACIALLMKLRYALR